MVGQFREVLDELERLAKQYDLEILLDQTSLSPATDSIGGELDATGVLVYRITGLEGYCINIYQIKEHMAPEGLYELIEETTSMFDLSSAPFVETGRIEITAFNPESRSADMTIAPDGSSRSGNYILNQTLDYQGKFVLMLQAIVGGTPLASVAIPED